MKGGGYGNQRSGKGEPYYGYSKPLDGAGDKDICQDLKLNSARLQRPTNALELIHVGDMLTVDVHNRVIVKILTQEGAVCGYLTDGKARQLAECIAKGNRYSAVVVYKNEAYCDLDIEKA